MIFQTPNITRFSSFASAIPRLFSFFVFRSLSPVWSGSGRRLTRQTWPALPQHGLPPLDIRKKKGKKKEDQIRILQGGDINPRLAIRATGIRRWCRFRCWPRFLSPLDISTPCWDASALSSS